ncbi:MAG: hypothetical protein QOG09_1120 [Solirubrobacterales bacterium]|jgi:hypothetical protein|nr:hypothetical protein [Solirubrobacterales bacterium]
MTRDEAERECERLGREHPERASHRWMPRQAADGSWAVARIGMSPAQPPDELITETRADEKPPTPDDVRPLVNPYWGYGG